MVKGKAIGIIGYGNISRAIIRRLAGWDARIVVSTRAPDKSSQGVAFVGLDQLLEESDVVIMMTSLTPESKNLLDAERLRKLRSEEHTSELQSLMRISYAVFCLKK